VSFANYCKSARSWVGTRRSRRESFCMAPTIAAHGQSLNAPHLTGIVGLTLKTSPRKRRTRSS
jgi:hypothetical protein